MEMEKLRQRSLDYGLLTLLAHLDLSLTHPDLKALFARDLWAVLDGDDFLKTIRPCDPYKNIDVDKVDAYIKERYS